MEPLGAVTGFFGCIFCDFSGKRRKISSRFFTRSHFHVILKDDLRVKHLEASFLTDKSEKKLEYSRNGDYNGTDF